MERDERKGAFELFNISPTLEIVFVSLYYRRYGHNETWRRRQDRVESLSYEQIALLDFPPDKYESSPDYLDI